VYLEKTIIPLSYQELSNRKYIGPPEKTNIKISGIIKDANSGESLPFASISVKGLVNGTQSNMDGYFTLFGVPSDTSALMISYIGYESSIFFLHPKMEVSNITILLKPVQISLNEVVVTGKREGIMDGTDRVSLIKMSPSQIAKLPNIGEKDIFRSFQLLPGVSGSNESSSGLFVRGGTPDQNLVLYDGFTVYHTDHLFGMFSAFNSNAVKDVQLHKGGFPAEFGGRISSVMEIIGKDGNENKFNLGGDIGLLSGNLFTEIPIKDKTTLLIAGRRSWKSPIYNSIFESFNENNEAVAVAPSSNPKGNRTVESSTPSSYFYDLNAKLTYKPTKKDIISYSFFNGQDDLDNSSVINRTRNGTAISGGTNDATKWGSLGMSTTWSRKWSDIFYTNTLVSMSDYFSERELSNSRVITNLEGETLEINRGSFEDNKLKDYTFEINNELKLGKSNQFEFGVQASNYNIDYNYTLNDTIAIQDRQSNGTVYSTFFQDRIKLFNRLSLVPGIRASYYDVTNKTYFEPRASVYYNL